MASIWLGVSARTFAGYVADLKAEYDADTRFQLGYVMGQQGVSGFVNAIEGKLVIGIDLGTTKSGVAVWREAEGRAVMLCLRNVGGQLVGH